MTIELWWRRQLTAETGEKKPVGCEREKCGQREMWRVRSSFSLKLQSECGKESQLVLAECLSALVGITANI